MNFETIFAPYSPPTTHVVDRLRYWAEAQPDDIAFRFLVDGEDQEIAWTYAYVDMRARAIGAKLVSMGMRGQRALMLYPPGLEFVAAFFGCHYAGAIPVPAYPPKRNRNMNRIQAISDDADAKVALTEREVLERVSRMLDDSPHLKEIAWLSTKEVPDEYAGDWVMPALSPNDIALLQYTSGSTGSPKGVMLTHRNILANCTMITEAFEMHKKSTGMSWLPTYHDMGLVGGILNPLFCGCTSTLMSPMAFLSRPVRWLRAIAKYRISVSGGPNFAYALCNEKVSEEECEGLDLSCWETAFNGAEPIRADVLEEFTRRFEKYGFRHNSHYPCYGMAETTLIVTGGRRDDPPIVLPFNGERLDQHEVVPCGFNDADKRMLVGCGRELPGERIVIVDPRTQTRPPDDHVGEIWVRSPSVGEGYWNKHEETEKVFHAQLADEPAGEENQFLRTGDLGFISDGELFVTGRLKDLIIIRGVNRYPQDIEATVEAASPQLRSAGAGAFGVNYKGRERLVVVAEVERGRDNNWDEVIHVIRSDVSAEHDVPPDAVILVRQGSIPKTSSGKIQRHACRNAFLDGQLRIVEQWYGWETNASDLDRHGSAKHLNKISDEAEVDPTIAEYVMAQVREVAKERAKELTLDSNLVVDLGLDSLERLEIASALEQSFDGRFPDEVLQDIETIREIAIAVKEHLGDRPLKLADVVAFDPKKAERRQPRDIPESSYVLEKMPEVLGMRERQAKLATSGVRNPFFSVHDGLINDVTTIDGRELISFASYNYLGLSGDPRVSQGAKDAIDRYGTSVSASRLVSGEKVIHQELESELAQFFGFGDVITFPGGHATNETVIGHLFGSGDLILHDSLAHNSIIQGAMLSGARRRPFEHNNWQALDQVLSEVRNDYRRVLIAIEGLYSMDGDSPDLAAFVKIKKKHKALLFVDEAHSFGTLGPTGRGIAEVQDVAREDVELWMGTLSKTFGSCGGFIGASKELIEYLRYTAPGFVFANGIPPASTGAALAAAKILALEPERVLRLQENSRLFLTLANELGVNTGLSHDSPVIPVITGDSQKALKVSEKLFKRGINAQPILYPAVEEKQARVRFFITSTHTAEQIRYTVDQLVEALAEIDQSMLQQPVSARHNKLG